MLCVLNSLRAAAVYEGKSDAIKTCLTRRSRQTTLAQVRLNIRKIISWKSWKATDKDFLQIFM